MPIKENTIEVISKLLATADDPGATEAERELAARRAQILSTRHSIDLEMAQRHGKSKEKLTPVVREFELGRKGERGGGTYSMLIGAICRANEVRVIFFGDARVQMVGYPETLDFVTSLFVVILPQMRDAALAYLEEGTWKKHTKNRWDARKSFCYGYTKTIEKRLADAFAEAQREADAAYRAEGRSTALVLSDRKREVNAMYKETLGEEFLGKNKSWDEGTVASAKTRGRSDGKKARFGNSGEVKQRKQIEG